MLKVKKIAIINTHCFGYIDFVVGQLKAKEGIDLTYINIDTVPFKYKNKYSRIRNFFSKIFLNLSLKESNRTNFIKNSISSKELYDQVLIIRPDKLQKDALDFLRANTIQMSCYLFDGIENFKDQKTVLSYFDTVFSYDKKDAEKYGFEFISNYIYDDVIEIVPTVNTVFNICSYDKRFIFLEKLADYLSNKSVSFRFIVKKDKPPQHGKIEFTKQYISLNNVKQLIAQSKILVDIQKENQSGLSFRVFEALGFSKKLITNNQDIVNYDFYNENNVFIISEKNYEIPASFFETDYIEVPLEILNKYKLKNWIFQVFKIECD